MPPRPQLLDAWRPPGRLLAKVGPLLMALALLAGAPAPGQSAAYRPEQVEAEMVARITEFIDWPPERLGDPRDPFVLGLLGQSGAWPALETLARERRLKGHPVELRRLDGPDGVTACHAVWIAPAADAQVAAVLARASGKPILTIGDTDGFAERGVLINLRRGPTNVTFEINLDTAKKSGLKLSSRLLALGKIVATQGAP